MAASLSFNPSSSFLPACPVDGMEWRETNDTPTPYPGTIDSGRFGSGRMSWRDGDVLRVLLPRWLALQCTEYSTVLGRRHKALAFPCSPKQASVVSFSVHCSTECDEQEGASLLPPCSFGLFWVAWYVATRRPAGTSDNRGALFGTLRPTFGAESTF
jgi:hypothetical protein